MGVTDMPFREEHIRIQDTEKKAQFFFDMNAKMDEGDGRGKKRKHDEGPPKAAGPCWFCLSSFTACSSRPGLLLCGSPRQAEIIWSYHWEKLSSSVWKGGDGPRKAPKHEFQG